MIKKYYSRYVSWWHNDTIGVPYWPFIDSRKYYTYQMFFSFRVPNVQVNPSINFRLNVSFTSVMDKDEWNYGAATDFFGGFFNVFYDQKHGYTIGKQSPSYREYSVVLEGFSDTLNIVISLESENPPKYLNINMSI
jgi:hypothetical protein